MAHTPATAQWSEAPAVAARVFFGYFVLNADGDYVIDETGPADAYPVLVGGDYVIDAAATAGDVRLIRFGAAGDTYVLH